METILRLPVDFKEWHFEAGEFSNLTAEIREGSLINLINKPHFGIYMPGILMAGFGGMMALDTGVWKFGNRTNM